MKFLLAILTALSLNPGDSYLPDGGIDVWDGGYECACFRPDAGACSVPGLDGGMQSAAKGVTLGAGWSGPGCVRKACREPNGSQGSSWPAVCP